MIDRETLLAVLDQIARLKQEHGQASGPLIEWTVSQMLERATDRWDDGFKVGLESRG